MHSSKILLLIYLIVSFFGKVLKVFPKYTMVIYSLDPPDSFPLELMAQYFIHCTIHYLISLPLMELCCNKHFSPKPTTNVRTYYRIDKKTLNLFIIIICSALCMWNSLHTWYTILFSIL